MKMGRFWSLIIMVQNSIIGKHLWGGRSFEIDWQLLKDYWKEFCFHAWLFCFHLQSLESADRRLIPIGSFGQASISRPHVRGTRKDYWFIWAQNLTRLGSNLRLTISSDLSSSLRQQSPIWFPFGIPSGRNFADLAVTSLILDKGPRTTLCHDSVKCVPKLSEHHGDVQDIDSSDDIKNRIVYLVAFLF